MIRKSPFLAYICSLKRVFLKSFYEGKTAGYKQIFSGIVVGKCSDKSVFGNVRGIWQ